MYKFRSLENGFKYIEITNDLACAKIAMQGAHLFHYERVGEEPLLWVSKSSDMQIGKNIRGGIPICWPSFGMNNPELPQHGFARDLMWDLVKIIDDDTKSTQVIMELKSSNKSLSIWEYKFHLELRVTIADTLTMELKTTNLDQQVFKLTQALHTYFNISHISNISILGLENTPYIDTLTSTNELQKGEITIDAEIDRVYQEFSGDIILKDKTKQTKIISEGSSSVVVWNPWIEKASRMSGMDNEGYKEFVCIESANAFDDYKILDFGESHTLKLKIV